MKISEVIKNIESTQDTKKASYKGLTLWLEFRNRFFYILSIGKESNLVIDNSLYITVLKSMFYGFFNWFKSYDCWVLSASNYRIKIGDKYFDKYFDYPASRIKSTLFIELSISPHFKRSEVFSKHIVSRAPLVIFEKIYSIFISTKGIDFTMYEDIQSEYNTKIDPIYSIKKMISQYKAMKLLLFFKKNPSVVFIAPSYMSFGYVKALKEKGVTVVEGQHGVINKEHFGYNYYEDYNKNYFPDYLLSFGEREQNVFDDSNTYIAKGKVIPVGSYYIDYISDSFTKEIDTFGYRLTFSVSMQDCNIGGDVLPFLIKAASQNRDCLFLLKPRRTPASEYNGLYELPINIRFVKDLDVYKTILHSDFHITAYSSCALEAPALGVKNILINFENKAKDYFSNVLDENTTGYVSTVDEFTDLIKSLVVVPKESVKKFHEDVFKSNYQRNVDLFLEKIKGIDRL